MKCPENNFFKDVEVFPNTQKLYIPPPETVERM
jgi:hypothetical protein